ncbi:GNAT family N-acetyltransferase [Streptomyces sp. NPDC086519]|uniref:GNAT family N-acetyltransferase n=1 Tax=Streptomyces sp. NPDC086519 TaxID=3154863 RepID=UPI003447C537
MSGLRVVPVDGDEALEQWRYVHNVVVPPAAMSAEEARERLARGYRLENAYDGDVLVGCSTVRPVADGVVTVIARVLPEFRRRGFGTALYEHALGHARVPGVEVDAVETCVLAVNEGGLRFAESYGFVEVERYVLDGESDEWVDLRLAL